MKDLVGWPKKLQSSSLVITSVGSLLMVTQQFWSTFIPAAFRGLLLALCVLVAIIGLVILGVAEAAGRRAARKTVKR